jgi:hypothetical protein
MTWRIGRMGDRDRSGGTTRPLSGECIWPIDANPGDGVIGFGRLWHWWSSEPRIYPDVSRLSCHIITACHHNR